MKDYDLLEKIVKNSMVEARNASQRVIEKVVKKILDNSNKEDK